MAIVKLAGYEVKGPLQVAQKIPTNSVDKSVYKLLIIVVAHGHTKVLHGLPKI